MSLKPGSGPAAPLRVLLVATILVAGCGGPAETTGPAGGPAVAPAAAMTGKALVDRHCVRCHLAPDPADLAKEYWPYALHYMGNYVGMKGDEFADFRTEDFPPELEPAKDYTKRYFLYGSDGYFRDFYPFRQHIPAVPEMSREDFQKIREYYVANARPWKEMELQEPKAPLAKLFRPVVPKLDLEPDALVLSTLVDPVRQRLYVGRTVIDDWVGGGERREGFDQWDDVAVLDLATGKRLATQQVTSDPIEMALTATGIRLVTHGHFPLSRVGIAAITDWEFEGGKARPRMLVNGKQRLVQHHTVDMNGDGLADIVANAFGDGVAADAQAILAIWYQTPEYARRWPAAAAEIPPGAMPGLREKVIAEDSGLISSAIADFNGDGRPDIAAVIAQGRQELILLINNGDETFTRHVLDRHTPSWGGNSLNAADFDGDGDPDLVVLNGDNVAGNHIGKVVPAPRPQHGIRVYRNDGDLKFQQQFYYRMHGAIRSVVRDFDGDGDPDIAAIALFPQWSEDEPETFVYLENKGGFRFEPRSIAREFFSVWCSIEAADVNGDGRTDIVLGLGNFPELVPPDWITAHKAMQGRGGKAPSVIYLLNQG
ncbi:MAG: VCBS repeat-containing protein [Chromatiales bacterium]|nr:VCBS repeat-containing protein [Chromatiales bacterium]